jgi:hypothetical protein
MRYCTREFNLSTAPASLVYPLILSASTLSEDAERIVQTYVTTVTKVAISDPSNVPVEWVLIQRTVGFDVRWYLLTLEAAAAKLQQGAAPDRLLWAALAVQESQLLKTVQLSQLTEWQASASVVLNGTRVVGIIPTAALITRAMEPPLVRAVPSSPKAVAPAALPAEEPVAAGAAPAPVFARPPSATEWATKLAEKLTGISSETKRALPETSVEAAAYVNAPRRTQPGKKIPLEVGLAATPPVGVEGGKVVVNFPRDETGLTLDIHLDSAGFISDEGAEHTLRIERDDPFTPRLKLLLVAAALPDGVDEELRALQIFFSYKGSACGSVTYRILVQRNDVVIAPPATSSDKPRVAIMPSAPAIDVTFRIAFQDDNEATHTLRWSFTSPHAIALPVGKMSRSSTELASLPIGIIDEVAQGDGVDGIELLMEGIGASITNEIPGGVWEVLANVRREVQLKRGANAVPTVLLLTQETRVPWELALVPDTVADTTRAKFLNTQFITTRWLLDDNITSVPPFAPQAQDVIAVYGDYADSNVGELPFAKKEADLFTSHKATTLTATRSNVLSVLLNKAMQPDGVTLAPGVVHFAGHGEAARTSTAASFLLLNDGSTLSMTYFLNAPGLRTNHPLVFLNACQTGAATTSLGQPGGFAGFCVRAGCSAVIAPLWSVNDEIAYAVAREFYAVALQDAGGSEISVAEAMFNARQKPYSSISETDANGQVTTRTTATRLAYIVYAHPAFHL